MKTSAQKQKEIEAYWARRNEELEAEWHKKCRREIEKELAEYYRQALSHIDDDIAALYARFADENGIDMTAAQRMLQGDEFRTWRMDIAEYVRRINETGDKELLRELNMLSMRSRITRLDKLRSDTLIELSKLSKKAADAIGKFLPSAYKDFYYRNLYEISKKAGIGVVVNRLNPKRLEDVTRTPWSGKNYSERIWHNSAELEKTLNQVMLTAMHRGSSINDLSRYVAQRMNVGIHDAERLVRTELNYVQNRAALDSIKDAGMKYYRFIATLDNRTSQVCREHDGKVFAVDDASAGSNMPPLHPRCRSTISGCLRALRGKPIGQRIARDADTGKSTVYVPAGMKYEDWYKIYVMSEKEQAVIHPNGKKTPIVVDYAYINTKAFHDQFDGLTNKTVSEALYKEAQVMLEHRSGSEIEDMVAIDAKTGVRLAINDTIRNVKYRCWFTEEQEKELDAGPLFEGLHIHPSSSPPSISDLKMLFKRKKQTASVVVGFDGSLYRVEKLKELEEQLLEKIIEKMYNIVEKRHPEINVSRLLELETVKDVLGYLARENMVRYIWRQRK